MLYLCYSINDFFAREAGISLVGFFENNLDYEPEEVFFLDYGIHAINKQKLESIAAHYGRRITYLKAKSITAQMKREFPHLKAWRGTMAPNAKAFVDIIMPDYVHRLLFVDADTVVAGSVRELNHLDMGGAALGVVPAALKKEELAKKSVKLESGNKIYFNSGVLLYDLDNWRRENCHQMILDMLQKKINLDWPDQNLLNNAIPERIIKCLPLKFNYLTHYYHPKQELYMLHRCHVYSEQEIQEAIHHPAIIHYLGGWVMSRPWYEGCRSTHSEEYLRYKALSPWKDTPLFIHSTDTKPPTDFRGRLSYWQMKQYSKCHSYRLTRLTDLFCKKIFWIMNKYEHLKQKLRWSRTE
ncbi:MAG: hypothetical protein J5720_00835 [Bacteroidaceae bacterium]|nr:hypothetical protein [Bacteroidaceae bacterium]